MKILPFFISDSDQNQNNHRLLTRIFILNLIFLNWCFLFFTPSLFSQDFNILEKKIFDHKLGSLPYRILYPEPYDPLQKYPLVLFLHGGGERGNDNEKQLIHGVKHFLEPASIKNFPCILVVPQCPGDTYWASVKFERTHYPLNLDFNYSYPATSGLVMAMDLVKSLSKTESVDKKRIYITGLSMGGMGTLEAVFRYPKRFAGAAVICGGGDEASYTTKQAKIPFWLFHGDIDGVVSVEHSREMVIKLKSLGADVRYTEYPGVNHNSWEKAYADPQLMEWLFSQRRK